MYHLLGSLPEFGKVGVVAIGDSREEAENYIQAARRWLDHVASCGSLSLPTEVQLS